MQPRRLFDDAEILTRLCDRAGRHEQPERHGPGDGTGINRARALLPIQSKARLLTLFPALPTPPYGASENPHHLDYLIARRSPRLAGQEISKLSSNHERAAGTRLAADREPCQGRLKGNLP